MLNCKVYTVVKLYIRVHNVTMKTRIFMKFFSGNPKNQMLHVFLEFRSQTWFPSKFRGKYIFKKFLGLTSSLVRSSVISCTPIFNINILCCCYLFKTGTFSVEFKKGRRVYRIQPVKLKYKRELKTLNLEMIQKEAILFRFWILKDWFGLVGQSWFKQSNFDLPAIILF